MISGGLKRPTNLLTIQRSSSTRTNGAAALLCIINSWMINECHRDRGKHDDTFSKKKKPAADFLPWKLQTDHEAFPYSL